MWCRNEWFSKVLIEPPARPGGGDDTKNSQPAEKLRKDQYFAKQEVHRPVSLRASSENYF